MSTFYSLNRQSPTVSFEAAVLHSLAPDGGLYYPTAFPRFSAAELAALRPQGGDDAALRHAAARAVLGKWIGAAIPAEALDRIVADAQSFPWPIRSVGDVHILELFHGPTLAFKDVAARTLAGLLDYFLQRRGERYLLLVSTSGDTGSAIAHGFADRAAIHVVVLYPEGRISQLQEAQMTHVAANVTPIAVAGDFDGCQALVKGALVDPRLAHIPMTAANSISMGRLLPQIIYYLYAWLKLADPPLEVTVPSGNFGNLTAGLFAQQMGVPLTRWIAATNANDATVRYAQAGVYAPRPTVQTLSTAMDVGAPSNFMRILELFEHDPAAFRARIKATSVSDAETAATIRAVYEAHGYLLCPHTAVGWRAVQRCGDPAAEPLLLATASPLKFAAEIRAATGLDVDDRAEIAKWRQRPKRGSRLANDPDAFAAQLQRIAAEVL
ncbi:MAG: threonine synthase [Anaerolineales bacterium]|nr:threonine synthase [Anaerolineales bacterium]MCB9128577.1 threonine synthase [Ardenticatenales bacterium]